MKNKRIFETLQTDAAFLKALSQIGIYISNYESGESLASHFWEDIENKFESDRTSHGFLDNIHPEDRIRVSNSLKRKREGSSDHFDETFRLKQTDGSYIWIKSYSMVVSRRDDGKPLLIVGSDTDVTDLKKTEKELNESIREEKKRSDELDTMRQMTASFNSSLDINETVQNILEEMKKIVPFQTASIQLLRDTYLEVIGASGFDDNGKIVSMRFNYPAEGSLSTKALQQRSSVLTNDIEKDFPSFIQPAKNIKLNSWIGVPLIAGGSVIGLMALDHSETGRFTSHHLELAEIIGDHVAIALENSLFHERAYKMAMEDALTKAGSRHRLQLEGRLIFETAIRGESNISLAVMDIDKFKVVNDEFGHSVGDEVLKRIAALCIGLLRTTDLFVRFGGEEFIILFPDTEVGEAWKAIERIRIKIEAIEHPEFSKKVTVSSGLYSGCPKKGENLNSFLVKADKALYLSKTNGRNRNTIFSD